MDQPAHTPHRGGARPNSGGKRAGAGAKPKSLGVTRVTFPSRVHPDSLTKLAADKRPGESLGDVLDRWAAKRK